MLTCTKIYRDYPFAHRAHNHDGHCKLIHGHNWTFEITFIAEVRDENGFVIDFGKLAGLKAQLDKIFDHTFLLNQADPLTDVFRRFTSENDLNNLRIVDDCSCEGIAALVWAISEKFVRDEELGRVRVKGVIVHEDSKNFASYEPDAKDQ